jgi:4-amino-4-deoxy-L-arabinose transferase-like glycosyltransferase
MRIGKAATSSAKRSEKLYPHSPHGGFQLDRTDWLAVGLISVLAAIPRLFLMVSLPPLLHLDSDSYFEIAQRLSRGTGFGDLSRRTPLYPLLLSLVVLGGKAGFFLLVLWQHLLGVGSAVLCYLIGRRLFPLRYRWAATASGMLAGTAIYPALVEHSILSESLFSFLLLAATWLLLVWFDESRNWAALGCGVMLGLAALTRPMGASLLFVTAGLLFALCGARQAMRFLLFGGAAFAALLFPLLLRNYRAMGSFSLSESLGRNLISVADPWVDYERGVELPVKSVYREYLNDKRSPDAVVIYSAMPALRRATRWSDARIDRALVRIAWEAIRAHPLEYLSGRLRRLPLLFRDPEASQWYALHAETYLPLLEFVGRFDPELVSRSVAIPSLPHTRFDLAGVVFRIFAIDLTSGWLFVFPLAGMVWTLRRERRGAAWLLLVMLAYLWIGTILVQPPNARYRIPTLPFEILFAVAGFCFLTETLFQIAAVAWRRRRESASATANQDSGGHPNAFLRSLSTTHGLWVIVVVILAILTVRTAMALEANSVFSLTAFQRNGGTNAVSGPGESDSLTVRELSMGGRKLSVLYLNAAAGNTSNTVSADVPVTGGHSYRLQAAYSCESRECAGALLRITFLDSKGVLLGPAAAISQPLAQERIDNDLFWGQIDRRFAASKSAQIMRVELAVQPGKGNLVVPYLSVWSAPSPFSLWRRGASHS